MQQVAIQRAKDIDPVVRGWLSRLFGRVLDDDERVTLTAFRPHPAPTGAAREATASALRTALSSFDAGATQIPAAEREAAIDEALTHTRRWKP